MQDVDLSSMRSTTLPLPSTTVISPYLTTIEAAAYLKLSPSTLNIWRTRKGHPLRFVLVGTRVRYVREDLDAFVAGCHTRRTASPRVGRPPKARRKSALRAA